MAVLSTLKLGSTGDDVKKLQTALNSKGANLAVDGVFGSNTLNAVKTISLRTIYLLTELLARTRLVLYILVLSQHPLLHQRQLQPKLKSLRQRRNGWIITKEK